jgi:hypothetical protein
MKNLVFLHSDTFAKISLKFPMRKTEWRVKYSHLLCAFDYEGLFFVGFFARENNGGPLCCRKVDLFKTLAECEEYWDNVMNDAEISAREVETPDQVLDRELGYSRLSEEHLEGVKNIKEKYPWLTNQKVKV